MNTLSVQSFQIFLFLFAFSLITSSFHISPKKYFSIPPQDASFSSLYVSYNRIASGHSKIITPHGGSLINTVLASTINSSPSPSQESTHSRFRSFYHYLTSFYATFSILAILLKSLKNLLPIALEPLNKPLNPYMYVLYALTTLVFAYSEGYKGFQQQFIPFVVSRSHNLKNETIIYKILAPLYSIGLIKSNTRRKIRTATMFFAVGLMIALTKNLSYPWRNVIDAGVVIGLGWGLTSGVLEWIRVSLRKRGRSHKVDLCLP